MRSLKTRNRHSRKYALELSEFFLGDELVRLAHEASIAIENKIPGREGNGVRLGTGDVYGPSVKLAELVIARAEGTRWELVIERGKASRGESAPLAQEEPVMEAISTTAEPPPALEEPVMEVITTTAETPPRPVDALPPVEAPLPPSMPSEPLAPREQLRAAAIAGVSSGDPKAQRIGAWVLSELFASAEQSVGQVVDLAEERDRRR